MHSRLETAEVGAAAQVRGHCLMSKLLRSNAVGMLFAAKVSRDWLALACYAAWSSIVLYGQIYQAF